MYYQLMASSNASGSACGGSNFCNMEIPSCKTKSSCDIAPVYGSNYLRQLRGLQAAADSIPVTRYVPQGRASSGCGCKSSCGCHSGCNCGCNSGCNCGCNSGCNCDCNSGCNSGCNCGGTDGCNCGGTDGCSDVQYFGYPSQTVSAGGILTLSRFSPACDEDPASAISLPCGKYLISYSVNASANLVRGTTPVPTTVTMGILPRINGVDFPRGGSFATVAFGVDTHSTTLTSSFVVSLPNADNTVSFVSTTQSQFTTDFQLLNITVTRVC